MMAVSQSFGTVFIHHSNEYSNTKNIKVMSQAFLKNDTQDEKVFIPPRAPLPPGTVNYVTLRGMSLLKSELVDLETNRSQVQSTQSDERERTRQLAIMGEQIAELNQRISSAKIIDARTQPQDEVRFGATVTLRTNAGKKSETKRRFQIVGVDEASATEGRVAFLAPIARVILGRRVGDKATLRTAQGEEVLEITAIAYGEK